MFWSMRNSSSRQVVGNVGEAFQVSTPFVGEGICAISAAAFGSMGTMSLTNRCPVLRSMGHSGKFVVSIKPGVGEHTSLKLPWRLAIEGTITLPRFAGTRSRRHSCDQKKNVFCLSLL